jgi:phytoene dehydrogenase-like protein
MSKDFITFFHLEKQAALLQATLKHRMPIPGLYQTSAITHPGGSVTGAPGRNASMVLLKDLGRNLNGVIGSR